MPAHLLTVFINGKFTAQAVTGVQRVGQELLLALDRRLAAAEVGCGDLRWVLLCPPQARPPHLERIEVRHTAGGSRSLHLWEQAILPLAARSGLLLNLAGTGPWLVRRQAVLLHDAAVFDQPQAHTRAFVRWYRSLFARQARSARPLCVVSEFSRDRLGERLRVPAERWQVIHPGADHLGRVQSDPRILDRLGLGHRPYFLAVGSANPGKNLPALLQAYAALPVSRPALVLVGGGNARVFAASAEAEKDPPGVLRAGRLDDAALKALYQRALALLFPSLYEGFGLPPLEAMALGCPVVAADAASLPEVCGDAALYVDPRSLPSMTAAMQRIVADRALCEHLRAAGRARAAGFTWDAAARRLCGLLVGEVQP